MRFVFASTIYALASSIATAAMGQVAPMSDYWPNDDHRAWTYAQRYQCFDPNEDICFDSNGEVAVYDVVAKLYFDGTTLAAGGIPVQVLVEQALGTSIAPRSAGEREAFAIVTDRLLRNVWRARPDLRSAIGARSTDQPCPEQRDPNLYGLFMSGGLTYLKSESEIASWRCNADNTRAWLWLTSNLAFGNTATLQLVPDLASDVFLYVTVAGLEDVATSVRVSKIIDGRGALLDHGR